MYILLPILMTLAMSFSAGQQLRFPVRALSLGWYLDFAGSAQWTSALANSLLIATGTMLLSTSTGVAAAWVFTRSRMRGSSVLYVIIMLPLFMPGVVLGLGIAMTFSRIEVFGMSLFGSPLLVVLAHSLWAMPLVFLLMEAVFRTVDQRLVEAALDLGARPWRVFVEVVLPGCTTGIFSSALFAFVISLNEFVMALFLTDRGSQTLPVLMWLSLRSAATPALAVASMALTGSVLIGLALIVFVRTRRARPEFG
ncbi:MAG: ABC transporter permease [Shinella sp.]|uniref:ABC transporter permease n=1 Tax=Shinella sp. TaxID=1870904 RepID=UPI004036D881